MFEGHSVWRQLKRGSWSFDRGYQGHRHDVRIMDLVDRVGAYNAFHLDSDELRTLVLAFCFLPCGCLVIDEQPSFRQRKDSILIRYVCEPKAPNPTKSPACLVEMQSASSLTLLPIEGHVI